MSAALKEWIGLLLLLALCGAAGAWWLTRPLDAHGLHVQVSAQGSLAAEAAILARQQSLGMLPLAVARHHAAQLSHEAASALGSLSGARVEPALQTRKDAASALGRQLLDEVGPIAAGTGADVERLERTASALQTLDRDVERAGP